MRGARIGTTKRLVAVILGVAMDRARIGATNVTLATPSGIYKDCLKVQEENPLDQEKEYKLHAPRIGLLQEKDLLLVKYGFVDKRKRGSLTESSGR